MNTELIKKFYALLFLIRRTEEEIIRLYPTDIIKSPVHLSIGQEAVSVAVCQALKPLDLVFGTYRGHAMYLAKGGNLRSMIAELYGKISGCAKGKGGSMHLIDLRKGVMGTSAVVGTTIPLAVGYAYALKYKNRNDIVACFFGDGAVDEGDFHEALNFAALKKLPVLFVCENNFYAIHSHHLSRHHSDNICERAKSYGMPAMRIKDGDIFKIYKAASRYMEKIRKGSGPAFIECITCRWKEHVGPGDDFHLGYRKKEEVACWKHNDPLDKMRVLLDDKARGLIESKIEKEIEAAFLFAQKDSFPGKNELLKDLFDD
ncbi:MAG: thiamine pyrophosphate-dependent dehydrogenase E1 component subunit alpha [Candidatus Omnitrophica bacterium]|nr:thiamine pyrophosphate-dependent dehydrogenase E1 component subunit alpha [Candidatus Omnitrophota bacterium]MDD5652685.1 thiamine pyrophosphate-dependent dehydrogenase E1 component subunit alpha [Candidatus Omnitrophota bacterium]